MSIRKYRGEVRTLGALELLPVLSRVGEREQAYGPRKPVVIEPRSFRCRRVPMFFSTMVDERNRLVHAWDGSGAVETRKAEAEAKVAEVTKWVLLAAAVLAWGTLMVLLVESIGVLP